jgi:hypothetical protein
VTLGQRGQSAYAGIAGAGERFVGTCLRRGGSDWLRGSGDLFDGSGNIESGFFMMRGGFSGENRLIGGFNRTGDHIFDVWHGRQSGRLYAAILGDGFAGQDDRSVVLRQRSAFILARFARLMGIAITTVTATTATITVAAARTSPSPAVAVSAITATAVTTVGIFTASAFSRRSSGRSFAFAAIVL